MCWAPSHSPLDTETRASAGCPGTEHPVSSSGCCSMWHSAQGPVPPLLGDLTGHCGQPWVFGILNPVSVDGLGKRDSLQLGRTHTRVEGHDKKGAAGLSCSTLTMSPGTDCTSPGVLTRRKRGDRMMEKKGAMERGKESCFLWAL